MEEEKLSLLLTALAENEEKIIQDIENLLSSLRFEIRHLFAPPDAAFFRKVVEEELHTFKKFLATNDYTLAYTLGKSAFNKGYSIRFVNTFLDYLYSHAFEKMPEIEFFDYLHNAVTFYHNAYEQAYNEEESMVYDSKQEEFGSILWSIAVKQQKIIFRLRREQKFDKYKISGVEKKVCKLAIRGKSNKYIAKALAISVDAVEDHLQHIYALTGMHDIFELNIFFNTAIPEPLFPPRK